MRLAFTSLPLSFALIACPMQSVTQNPVIAEKGWEAFGTARTGDGPGTIFRVDPEGKVFRVAKVDITVESQDLKVFEISSTQEFSLEEILAGVGLVRDALPAKIQTQLNKKSTSTRASLDGFYEYYTDQSSPDVKIAITMKDIAIRPNNSYYIVRETVSSNNLTFAVDNNWLLSLGIEAEVKSSIANNTGIKYTSGEKASFAGQFPQRMRLWYKAETLQLRRSLGIAGQPLPSVRRAWVKEDDPRSMLLHRAPDGLAP